MRIVFLSFIFIVTVLVSLQLIGDDWQQGDQKSEEKGKGREQMTTVTEAKEVPTDRPEGVPENWILFYDWEVGYSLYYPPDWRRFIPEHTNPKGLKLWKKGYYSVIEIRIAKKINSNIPLQTQIREVLKYSAYEGREERQQEVQVGKRVGTLIRKPAAGVMDTAIFNSDDYIFYFTLVEGGEEGGGEVEDTPINLKDEHDFMSILTTFQFAE